jgi:AraC family ethanolamine operon transcriptional activator
LQSDHDSSRSTGAREPSGDAVSAWGVEDAELEEVEGMVRGWRPRLTPLSAGPCTGSVRECVLPSLRLVRLEFSAAVALSSRPLGDATPFQVGVVSPAAGRFLFDGRRVESDRMLVKNGGERSHLAMPAGCEFIVARLSRSRISELVNLFGGPDPGTRIHTYRVPGPAIRELRSHLNALAKLDPKTASERIGVAEHDVYQRIALALSAGPDAGRSSPQARRRVLRIAEDYTYTHVHERLSLAELCRVSGCSERTLRSAFQEHYGMSPAAFIKRVRLKGLRSDLLDATPRSTRVIDLALRWGFWHPGHLSRDYKRLFGETPVETLLGKVAGVKMPAPDRSGDVAA